MSAHIDHDLLNLREELKASEVRFYNLVEISPDGLVVVNETGSICFINDAAKMLFGRQNEHMLGKEFGFPVVSGEKAEIEILNKNGTFSIVEMRVVEIRWEKQPAFLACLRDISEHTRLIAELNTANAELRHFSYAVSHDIKGPLRNVKTLADLLVEDYSSVMDSDAATDLRHIESNVNRMLHFVDGLLEFSRIGASEDSTKQIELNDVFADVLENIKTDIVKSKAKISVDTLPSIRANEVLLISLFQNLISNSIKYCKDRAPIITVSVQKRRDQCEIAIADNGIGIEEQHWNKIFLPFERLHTQTQCEGSGIGLASCKKITDYHDGRIWVESEVGRGSVFFVSLPCNRT